MGSIFSGLVQCGAWGCFDEFNRIEAEVLSVVSSQIKQIQEALKNDLTRFQFEGKEINIDPRTGIFITMNPGYAGRTELPDNLKVGACSLSPTWTAVFVAVRQSLSKSCLAALQVHAGPHSTQEGGHLLTWLLPFPRRPCSGL